MGKIKLQNMGKYAVYEGRTFESPTQNTKVIELVSKNMHDISFGFREYTMPDWANPKYWEKFYTLEIPINQVQEFYSLRYDAIYKGERVSILGFTDNDTSTIYSNDNEVITKLGLKTTSDKFIWQKDNIPNDELEFIPVKTDLLARYKN